MQRSSSFEEKPEDINHTPNKEEQNQKLKVVLVRHAQSRYNLAQATASQAKDGNEDEDVKYNPDLSDCELSDEGQRQCQVAKDVFKDEKVAMVFCSPLVRALTTASNLFKDHPSNPPIVVVPSLKEHIEDAGDVPGKIETTKIRFSHCDFSFLKQYKDESLWFLEEIGKNPHTELFLSQTEKVDATSITKFMRELKPECLEPRKDVIPRLERAKQMIKKHVRDNLGGREGKIVLVGHGVTFYYLTAESINEASKPVGGKYLKNAEPYEMEI